MIAKSKNEIEIAAKKLILTGWANSAFTSEKYLNILSV
jgi:hypothetical protein